MARRKKRGLNGSPEHHLSEAKGAAKEAEKYFDKVAKFATGGMCASALSAFNRASVYEGEVLAHQRESGDRMSVSARGRVVDAYEKAEKAFSAVCLKSGSINGLRRRRRK
jgi:hypothetical protein